MHLGLFLINIDVCATDPGAAVRIAVAAEAAGARCRDRSW